MTITITKKDGQSIAEHTILVAVISARGGSIRVASELQQDLIALKRLESNATVDAAIELVEAAILYVTNNNKQNAANASKARERLADMMINSKR